MKKLKPIVGALGLMMLFLVPSEQAMVDNLAKSVIIWALSLGMAFGMLAYAGAFKHHSETT